MGHPIFRVPYTCFVSCQLNLVFFGAADTPTDKVTDARRKCLKTDMAVGTPTD